MIDEYKKRMPRFNKIHKIKFPDKGEELVSQFEYEEDDVPSIITLRRVAFDDTFDLSNMAYKALKKSGKDPERVEEMEKNRGFIERCHDESFIIGLNF